MKLRLVQNVSKSHYMIERKDGWLDSWTSVYGATKSPTNTNTNLKPTISDFDGGWFYKDKQFAIESMKKYMKDFKKQELEELGNSDDFKIIEIDSKDWA